MGRRRGKLVLAIAILMLALVPAASAAAVIIDHTCTDLSQIPDAEIEQAKSNLHFAYQHTSHGSQLVTGMNALKNFPSFGTKYEWSDDGSAGLDLDDYGIPGCADLSQGDWIDGNGVTPWVTATRNLLDNPANYHVNVIMWSWCSINGHNITRYLENMELLVAEYPNVDFVFMTGHAEGQGEGGFIYAANQQIRQHCIDNDRILFDFADIESYDPDGNYYYDKPMWDDLDYNQSRTNNWGLEWCSANVGSELEQLTTGNDVAGYGGCGNCAHSGSAGSGETLNCVLKGRAVWWMIAGLAAEGLAISVAPTSHDFCDMHEGETDNTTFEIWNLGTYTLTYSLSESCVWVAVDPTSGSSTGEHDTITVEINTTGLAVGAYTCDIAISSNGGSDTFSVTVNIIPSTGSISVTSTPSGATIDLEGFVGPIVTTPYTFTNVPAGVHTLNLTLTGYHNWTTTVQVTAGETAYVDATLTPIPTTGDIRINEIMYNPSTEQGDDANMEWIELYNNDTEAISINGWTIDERLIADMVMEPEDYVVLARNKTAFDAYYGALPCSVIAVILQLQNDPGDTIVLRNSAGAEMDNVTYQTSWGADGDGKTLERKSAGEWAESLEDGGTQCLLNSVTPCFIATAAYGTHLHDDIAVLRDFRDVYLMSSPVGRTCVKLYYSLSPPIADLIRGNEGLMAVTREGLVKPLVYSSRMFLG